MTVTPPVFEVVVTREDGAWLADVPAVAGAHTYARSLPGLRAAVREVVVLMADLDDNAEPVLSLRFEVPDPTVTTAAAVGDDRRAVLTREAAVQARTAQSVTELTARGYSVRDSPTSSPSPPDASPKSPPPTPPADLSHPHPLGP